MRLFIAIQLSDDVRRALCQVQDRLRRYGVSGNYTRPENLHLTLAFIGEYTDVERVHEAMSSIEMRPFLIRLRGIGVFNDLWWVGLEASEALNGYVKSIRHALAEADIPFDRKRFLPHITILRQAKAMKRIIVSPPEEAGMLVERVSLMRSDCGKGGVIYTEV